eukprot:TRINITY_DN106958_c0_g1_i1.p1 TRINITY_DN106958_c0_g1~~TRINITY_DN106958_c0_g1_i1.p1  ORF type:complete len:338 (-),score=76.08 TRINITY_DN106958_c0_g1_i1:44-1057(-)
MKHFSQSFGATVCPPGKRRWPGAALGIFVVAAGLAKPAYWGVTPDHTRHPRELHQLRAVAMQERVLEHELSEREQRSIHEVERRLARAGVGSVPAGLLQHCCRAADWDAEQAYVQVRNCLRWRSSQKVDSILDSIGTASDEQWYRQLLHYDIIFPDRKGRAVMIEEVGKWDMKDIDAAAANQKDRMLRSHIFVCETLLRYAQRSAEDASSHEERSLARGAGVSEAGRVPVRGFVAVLDLAGISAKQNPLQYPELLSALREISQINALYYPGAVEHVFIVNAPMVFNLIWKALSPFVMPSSGVQVHVLRQGRNQALLQECGPQALPPRLGGTAETPGR